MIFITCLQVGDPYLCTKASKLLMEKHGIYVQDINYPTVSMEEERLRIAPTPHHNDEMKRQFVDVIVDVWDELQLPFAQNHVPEVACSKIILDVPEPPLVAKA